MTETPGWTSPGSPEPAPGTAETGHPAHPASPTVTPAPPPPATGLPAGAAAPQTAPHGPTPGLVPLRPLGFGEVMDGTFALIRRNWRAAFGLSLVLAAAVQLVQAGVDWWIHTYGTSTEALLSSYWTTPLSLVVGALATGLLAPVVSNGLLGRDTSLADAWALSRPHRGRLVGLSALLGLILLGTLAGPIALLALLAVATDLPGLLALSVFAVLPGIWLWTRLTLAVPALVLEKQPVTGALKRSWRLVRGSWWRIFGLLLVFSLCLGVLSLILAGPGQLAARLIAGVPGSPGVTDADAAISIAVTTICGVIAGTVTIPLSGGLHTLIYVDQRIRREALDLELARAAGLPGYTWDDRPAAPVPGPTTAPGV